MEDVKKWSYNDIKIKLENLKKIINPFEIEHQIIIGRIYTDDITDAMNIAFYNLKRQYSKVKGSVYGLERQISYTPRQHKNPHFEYINFNNVYNWDSYTTSSWTITTNTNGLY